VASFWLTPDFLIIISLICKLLSFFSIYSSSYANWFSY
jgi:hypothetical protein